jgi:enolase-phosphatase E1
MAITDQVQAIVLDIEGTTTPVDFVIGVLFPFARDRLATFLTQEGNDPAVQADLAQLRQEYAQESPTATLPAWEGMDPLAAVPYLHYLMDCDRKSTGLKSLQGKIWDQGYANGTLQSQIFPDVKPALEHWHQAGKRLYIYSSGSIQAQRLLFAHSETGDLTPLLSGYFDTTTGSKKVSDSYEKIAASLGLPGDRILFISDVVDELKAAKTAGFQVVLSDRLGNSSQPPHPFPVMTNFADL